MRGATRMRVHLELKAPVSFNSNSIRSGLVIFNLFHDKLKWGADNIINAGVSEWMRWSNNRTTRNNLHFPINLREIPETKILFSLASK